MDFSPTRNMFSCYLCLGAFHSEERLNMHIQTLHQGFQEYFSSPNIIEPRNFSIKNMLEQQYSCEKCQETFTSETSLRKHKNTHREKKQFKCDLCSKSYACKETLAKHKKTHIQYSGDHCEKALSESDKYLDKLSIIRKSHANAQQFTCNYCGMIFDKRNALYYHKQKHSKTKFPCDVCDKFFFTSHTLSQHKRGKRHQSRCKDLTNSMALDFVIVEVDDTLQDFDNQPCQIIDEDPLFINNETSSNETIGIDIQTEDQNNFENESIDADIGSANVNEEYVKSHDNIVYNVTVAQAIAYFSR